MTLKPFYNYSLSLVDKYVEEYYPQKVDFKKQPNLYKIPVTHVKIMPKGKNIMLRAELLHTWMIAVGNGYSLASSTTEHTLFSKRLKKYFIKSFERLYRKSRTSDGLCNLQDENILLRSYEKNLIRILHVLISDNTVSWHLREYFLYLKDKLDSHSKNQFLNRLKQWMNFDQLRKLNKKELVNSSDHFDEINTFDINNFEKSVQREIQHTIFNRINDTSPQRVTRSEEPFYFISQYYLLELLSKIEQSYSFLIYDRLSKRSVFSYREYRSFYYNLLERELQADIIGFLRLLHVTESWVIGVKEINGYAISKIKHTIESIKDLSNGNNNLYISRHLDLTNSEVLESYIEFFQKMIQNNLLKRISANLEEEKYIFCDWLSYDQQGSARQKLLMLYLDLMRSSVRKKSHHIYHIEYLQKISKNIKSTVAQDYIRLIMSVAKNPKYRNVDKSDLLQEGLIGLAKAVERFQLDRGYQFTTYATWWVHQALNRVLADYSSNIILIPTHLQRKIHLIQSTSRLLGKRLKREPLIEEVATELKIPIQKIYQFLETSTLSKRLISLDQKVASSDNRTYQHFIKAVPPRVPVSINRLFIYLLRFLSPRDATIMRMRLGIIPYKKHTMEQVARIFSVNREKIKNIEKYSLHKIRTQLLLEGRHSSLASRLSKYLADQILYT